MPITNKCNNYCIMCHACSKDYSNHTYYNAPPYEMSLEQIGKIFTESQNTLLKKIFKKKDVCRNSIEFLFGTAESLLNQQSYEIFRYMKSIYPNCKIKLISNGTIFPQPEEIVQYIDRIGFSVDGCTKDTYEFLRTPSKFRHAMQVLERWDSVASKYNDNFTFGLGVVLSSKNVHELAGIVKLASGFQHIDSVYIQPIILHESLQMLNDLLLDNVDNRKLEQCIFEAEEMSKHTGVRLDGLDLIKSKIYGGNEIQNSVNAENSRYCRYMWNGILSLNEEGKLRYLCCYMEKNKGIELLERYKLPLEGRIEAIYNSKEFWKLREDMLNGKLIKYCNNCNLCNAGYENMKNQEIKEGEYFYV